MVPKLNISTISTEEYNDAKDFLITYSYVETKFGSTIVGVHKNRLCSLAFYDINKAKAKDKTAIDILQKDWPNAILKEESHPIVDTVKNIFSTDEEDKEIDVLLKGTNFQIEVWRALMKLKPGTTTSYEEIAQAIGKPTAVRVVANAVARNRIAYIIPCHRAIYKSGGFGKYRWGSKLKEELLNFEKV